MSCSDQLPLPALGVAIFVDDEVFEELAGLATAAGVEVGELAGAVLLGFASNLRLGRAAVRRCRALDTCKSYQVADELLARRDSSGAAG